MDACLLQSLQLVELVGQEVETHALEEGVSVLRRELDRELKELFSVDEVKVSVRRMT